MAVRAIGEDKWMSWDNLEQIEIFEKGGFSNIVKLRNR